MNTLSKDQFFEFAIMLYDGMVLFFLYQLFRKLGQKIEPKPRVAAFQEMLFFLFAAVLTGCLLDYASYGAIGGHMVVGFFSGILLSKAVLWSKHGL